ncbi:MAG: hypothetical protein U5M50_13165, partial [Sphingobium sp.]|nr:hypothetical protein [Sphingobium sp.]
AEVTAALSPKEIEEKFDLGYHLKHVDTIFQRVSRTAADRMVQAGAGRGRQNPLARPLHQPHEA